MLVIKRNLISKHFLQKNLDFKEIFININSYSTYQYQTISTVSRSIHTNRNSLIQSFTDSNRFVIFVNEFGKSLPGYLYILKLFPIRHGIFLNVTGRKTDSGQWKYHVIRFYRTKPSPVEKRNGRKVLLQGVHLMTCAFFFFFFSTFEQDEFSRNFLVTRLSERWSVT